MVLRKLALANLLASKARSALTVAAVALSVSLVVSVTSGYASIFEAAMHYLTAYTGSADAVITHRGTEKAAIEPWVLTSLRQDPDVRSAVGRLHLDGTLADANGNRIPSRLVQLVGLDRPADQQVEALPLIAGRWFDASTGNQAVIDQVTARKLKDPENIAEDAPSAKVGDEFILPSLHGSVKLQIVGIVRKPGILASQIRTVYLPIHTLANLATGRDDGRVSQIIVQLQPGADPNVFARRWDKPLFEKDPQLRFRLTRENRQSLDQKLQGLTFLSYMGGTVAMLAATFIIFSSLSMGVTERQRTLAMLRAIGTSRGQLGRLVVGEGLILAIAGIATGVPLGWLLLQALAWFFPDVFTAGAVTSWGGVTFGALGSLLTALAASFLPAWSAMRISPLEAMSPLARPTANRIPRWTVILGLSLLLIDPFLLMGPLEKLFGPAPDHQTARQIFRAVQLYAHFILGIPALMIGFFLLAPLFVWTIERLFGPLVAPLLRLRYALLRQQLTGSVWRAAGTGSALMVGLAVLVVMQIQGHSALQSWHLPDKFPDAFIFSPMSGLNDREQQQLAQIQGIKPDEIMPIAIAVPQFSANPWAVAGFGMIPSSTIFFGVDPDIGLKMLDLDFRDDQGREVSDEQEDILRQHAWQSLKKGRHLLITEEFRALRKLKVGDPFPLETASGQTVNYTIAGIVWSPGLDVIKGVFDMAQEIDQRTASSVFGTLDDAQRDFGVQNIRLFAVNLQGGIDRIALLKAIKKDIGKWGLYIGDVREIKWKIQQGFGRLLLLASAVAFAAMAVASLGVSNTIMASIRSRRWQLGIFRSIGMTRGGILALVLAEGFLLGLVGCTLGLAAGFLMSLNARAFSATLVGFKPPLDIPWTMVLLGSGIVMAISLLASLWPAARVARSEPLHLLQAGRAAG